MLTLFFIALFSCWPATTGCVIDETKLSLTRWEVSIDGGTTFQPITVPGTVEDQIQLDFDGVSIYRTNLPSLEINSNQSIWLAFQGVATEAKVYLDDQFVGEHLGGWTPFRFELTHFLKSVDDRRTTKGSLLTVVVDEKVGHNTQGFLPIITYHFGGIWQPVDLIVHGNALLDDHKIAVRMSRPLNQLQFEVPVIKDVQVEEELRFFIRPTVSDKELKDGKPLQPWHQLPVESQREPVADSRTHQKEVVLHRGEVSVEKIPFQVIPWELTRPQLYEFKIELYQGSKVGDGGGQLIDQWCRSIGFRDFVVQEDGFLLNGRSVNLRGLLNWGYAPPGLAPTLDESRMRSEIEFAQSRGFNLMKFCLWIPPRRYLELCDEMGMLAWIEYPTWHPKLDQEHLGDLKREYQEFFEFDRNYVSVVLRSLTCETGPSADLAVIQALYDQCKRAIPGAIVVDDSSWISWNRVFDFYDDHPYGNNHTWVATLARLKDYIAQRELKPLVLGEAIAADTWTIPTDRARKWPKINPAHGAWAVEDNLRWQTEMSDLADGQQLHFRATDLFPHSRHYGMLMRKYQIETFHREIPKGGYVVSVIRDFPKAAMGLIDFEDRPKSSIDDWRFQGARMLILQTENDRRSFFSNEPLKVTVIAKNNEAACTSDELLELKLIDQQPGIIYQGASASDFSSSLQSQPNHDSEPKERLWDVVKVTLGALSAGSFEGTDFELAFPAVTRPRRFILRAEWGAGTPDPINNEWPIWVFPPLTSLAAPTTSPSAPPGTPQSSILQVQVHPSARELVQRLDLPINPRYLEEGSPILNGDRLGGGQPPSVLITRRLTSELLEFLGKGGRVLMFPDGSVGSFPRSSHWFLRGAPALFSADDEDWNPHFLLDRSGGGEEQSMMIELQHFDLGGDVIPEIDAYLPWLSPRVLLWDNHDRAVVKTHGLVFRMELGEGILWVSALNHQGATNAVGQWLVLDWLANLAQPELKLQMDSDTRQQAYQSLASDLAGKAVGLHHDRWRFRPVPEGEADRVSKLWAGQDFDDSDWDQIRIDRHWESQGYESLDEWAWYRKKVVLPQDWQGSVFLNFTGVDDYADVFVNGTLVGALGDLENRITAFDQQASFDISHLVAPGESLQIAVAVYDWYGAGGIFRPVSLTNRPLSEKKQILISQ